MPIRVLAADDHEVFRDGLKGLFRRFEGITLAGIAADGPDLLFMARELSPDIVLTDIRMPGLDGITATRKILSWMPGTGVIAFSGHGERCLVQDMFAAGARGYLLKNDSKQTIAAAIHAVYKGHYCVSPLVQRSYALPEEEAEEALTHREKEVLWLLCRQKATQQIAAEMGIAVCTVNDHRRELLRKTGATNLAGLVLYAVRYHLFHLPPEHLST